MHTNGSAAQSEEAMLLSVRATATTFCFHSLSLPVFGLIFLSSHISSVLLYLFFSKSHMRTLIRTLLHKPSLSK